MSQPSLLHSFDTSLIDVQSFSSTETNTSGSSTTANQHLAPKDPPPRPDHSAAVSTADLYDEWAATYDLDGNVLQAVDDLQMTTALPDFAAAIITHSTRRPSPSPDRMLQLLDLGCGTGRNTSKLLQYDWGMPATVTGWDASPAMLAIARQKCTDVTTPASNPMGTGLQLEARDVSDLSRMLPDETVGAFDGVLSTLVAEHLSLSVFWTGVRRVLAPGGYALVSNMHPEMGARTQAGFKTADGTRMQGRSYVHGVQETVEAAEAAGLEIVGRPIEVQVTAEMLRQGTVGDRGRKWIGVNVWYGLLVRRG